MDISNVINGSFFSGENSFTSASHMISHLIFQFLVLLLLLYIRLSVVGDLLKMVEDLQSLKQEQYICLIIQEQVLSARIAGEDDGLLMIRIKIKAITMCHLTLLTSIVKKLFFFPFHIFLF